MGYLRKTSNYQERIILFDLTHIVSMNNPVAINLEKLMIDIWCSLEKEFTDVIGIIHELY